MSPCGRTSCLRWHQKATRSNAHLLKSSLCLFIIFLMMAFGINELRYARNNQDVKPSISLPDAHAMSFDRPRLAGPQNNTPLVFDMPYESEWRQHAHLVVFGVLSTDKPQRQEIRNNQRSSWLQYPDVAKRSNAFEGLMLVLYAVCPLTSKKKVVGLSDVFNDEMQTHRDVVLLRMKEEAPTGRKVIGKDGYYGLGADVSMTRKSLFYMLYVYNAFPSVPFIAKGDDDSYVHVPEYLRMLRQLPRINTIYGAVSRDKIGDTDFPRRTALGMGYTLTRDILRDAVSDDAIHELFTQPYAASLTDRYHGVYFHHEDCIIGKALDKRYGIRGAARRALPNVPEKDARLPAVEGWGKAYMAYIRDPQYTSYMGRAVNADGRYNLTYNFPSPNTLHAGNVLWVNDLCRIKMCRLPNISDTTRTILAHRPVTAEEYKLHWDYHQQMGEDASMQRPYHVEMRNEGYFIDVSLSGVGPCNTKI